MLSSVSVLPGNKLPNAFERFQGHSFFSSKTSGTEPAEEIYLPFWVTSAKVTTRIVQAEVGFDTTRPAPLAPTRPVEDHTLEYNWYSVLETFTFEREYKGDSPYMQTYASYKYRRDPVHAIRGSSVKNAQPFSPSMLDAWDGSHVRKVDPFIMLPSVALRFAESYIRYNEERQAEWFLERKFRADRVRELELDIKIQNMKVHPVYFPVYLYTFEHLGRKFRTFVNAHDLKIGGMRLYDWHRVSAVTALGMGWVMWSIGGIGHGMSSIATYWLGIALPTALASIATLYYPLFSRWVRDRFRQGEYRAHHHGQESNEDVDPAWVGAYDKFEEERRYQNWRENQEQKQGKSRRANSADALGYYRMLGVSSWGTKQDIQAAFRGLALRYHPDRFTDPEAKLQAKKKFQEISQAYMVLRDPKRRRIYDSTGDVE
ncbi:DnaJ domain-containing protein [Jimgerdemannia flammicorona]|uniref:DnaJ domain-containing protein n=1 Tax=Jimgerdemannia flammicorona TaxID=994334 RepID=A0A433A1U2_9FUNG|nr:DnaJ domain-containing protein [Jimgerdemannia flammicorona]